MFPASNWQKTRIQNIPADNPVENGQETLNPAPRRRPCGFYMGKGSQLQNWSGSKVNSNMGASAHLSGWKKQEVQWQEVLSTGQMGAQAGNHAGRRAGAAWQNWGHVALSASCSARGHAREEWGMWTPGAGGTTHGAFVTAGDQGLPTRPSKQHWWVLMSLGQSQVEYTSWCPEAAGGLPGAAWRVPARD